MDTRTEWAVWTGWVSSILWQSKTCGIGKRYGNSPPWQSSSPRLHSFLDTASNEPLAMGLAWLLLQVTYLMAILILGSSQHKTTLVGSSAYGLSVVVCTMINHKRQRRWSSPHRTWKRGHPFSSRGPCRHGSPLLSWWSIRRYPDLTRISVTRWSMHPLYYSYDIRCSWEQLGQKERGVCVS